MSLSLLQIILAFRSLKKEKDTVPPQAWIQLILNILNDLSTIEICKNILRPATIICFPRNILLIPLRCTFSTLQNKKLPFDETTVGRARLVHAHLKVSQLKVSIGVRAGGRVGRVYRAWRSSPFREAERIGGAVLRRVDRARFNNSRFRKFGKLYARRRGACLRINRLPHAQPLRSPENKFG